MQQEIIALGKLVALNYKLTGYDENPDEVEDIEETQEGAPFRFIYGMGTVLPAFEKNIAGKAVGDAFDFMLTPSEAYGEYDDALVVELPKQYFCDEKGNFLSQYIKEGEVVPLQNQDGQIIQATVQRIDGSTVTCDVNHPLAGMTLRFTGTVADVHDPTEDDKKMYMQQSCGGDCGCGCGGDCGGGDCHCDDHHHHGGGHHHHGGDGCHCGHHHH